jgi:hypothetical protein
LFQSNVAFHLPTQEFTLKKLFIHKAAIAVSLASLLAACGGGGGGSAAAPEAPAVAWGSPAAFVTPGAASKSFALDYCSMNDYANGGAQQDLYNATLQIASNGDVIISAATATTGTVSPIITLKFADAQYSNWSVGGTTQEPGYSVSMSENFRNRSASFDSYSNVESSRVYGYKYDDNG